MREGDDWKNAEVLDGRPEDRRVGALAVGIGGRAATVGSAGVPREPCLLSLCAQWPQRGPSLLIIINIST